jgi:hypothetical protein
MAMKLGNLIDRAIGVVSPESACRRMYFRDAIRKRQQFAAAKIDRLTGGWSPANQDINEIIKSSRRIVKGRARQLSRDFPYFKRAAKVSTDFVVGSAIDLNNVSTAEVEFERPNGSRFVYTASKETPLTAGYIRYTNTITDGTIIDMPGTWKWRPKLTFTDSDLLYGDWMTEQVVA